MKLVLGLYTPPEYPLQTHCTKDWASKFQVCSTSEDNRCSRIERITTSAIFSIYYELDGLFVIDAIYFFLLITKETSLRLCHSLGRQQALSVQHLRYDNFGFHCMLEEFINFPIMMLQSRSMSDDVLHTGYFY